MDIRPDIDLKLLYYFTILAEEKHFGAAARRIGIEQPPLSLQIQKLEKLVGAALFYRGRQVGLTPVGQSLLPEAVKLLEQSRLLTDGIRRVGRGEAGVLSVGFATSTIFFGLTTAIQQFKKRHPGVELRLQELSSAAQMEALRNGTIDVGIIREARSEPGIECQVVLKERFIAVLSHQHPLSKEASLKFGQLKGEPFVHFPRSVAPALYDKVDSIFAAARFQPHIVQEAFEWQTIVSLVEANLGVSICPASFQKLKIGKVQYKPITDIKAETSISVCFRGSNESKLLTPFLHVMNEVVDATGKVPG